MYRFTLTYSAVDTTIVEPKDWSNFQSELDRDFNAHGATFEYTSGTIKLGFAGGGRTVLETAYQADGLDAVVTFTADYRADAFSTWITKFTGNAIMQNREYNQDYFEVDFEESGFKQKLKNRLKTKVKLDTTIDLDGNALSGSLTSRTSDWETLRFFNKWKAFWNRSQSSILFDTYNYSVAGSATTAIPAYLHSNYSYSSIEEVGVVQTLPAATLDGVSGNTLVMLKPDVAGTYTFIINIHQSIEIDVLSSIGSDPVTADYTVYLAHEDSGFVDKGGSPYALKTDTDSGVEDEKFNFFVNEQITQDGLSVLATDNFRVYVTMNASRVSSSGTMDADFSISKYHDSSVTFQYLTATEVVPVKYWLLYDVIERIVQVITGQVDGLTSSFLKLTEQGAATDGCGGLNMITNGFQLRGIDNPLELSLKDCLDHVIAEYGAGWGYKNVYGSYTLLVELMEFFYQDNEILNLGSPLQIEDGESYTEKSFDPLLINNIKIGYKKFSSDEEVENDAEDFLTETEYQTPVASIEGSYAKVSPLIASGRLIQATYDARQTPDKTWKYDENIFIVAAVRSGVDFIPENNENFSTVTGIDDPLTAYNLRKSPVQMFLNHALLVNSACFGKATSEIIQNVSVKINKSFTQQYISYALCKLGDAQNLLRTSTGNITIANNFSGLKLWNPISHEFTIAMTDAQYEKIVQNLENNGVSNNGYLTYKDNEGNVKQGFPMNIKRSPVKSIATVTTLEKS